MKNLITFLFLASIFASNVTATIVDTESFEIEAVKAALGEPMTRLTGRAYATHTIHSMHVDLMPAIRPALIALDGIDGYKDCFSYLSLKSFLSERVNVSFTEIAIAIKLKCNP